jgi:hypothetical protein
VRASRNTVAAQYASLGDNTYGFFFELDRFRRAELHAVKTPAAFTVVDLYPGASPALFCHQFAENGIHSNTQEI